MIYGYRCTISPRSPHKSYYIPTFPHKCHNQIRLPSWLLPDPTATVGTKLWARFFSAIVVGTQNSDDCGAVHANESACTENLLYVALAVGDTVASNDSCTLDRRPSTVSSMAAFDEEGLLPPTNAATESEASLTMLGLCSVVGELLADPISELSEALLAKRVPYLRVTT